MAECEQLAGWVWQPVSPSARGVLEGVAPTLPMAGAFAEAPLLSRNGGCVCDSGRGSVPGPHHMAAASFLVSRIAFTDGFSEGDRLSLCVRDTFSLHLFSHELMPLCTPPSSCHRR